MKEQPKGAVARATAVAEGVANAVRRRQRERSPRVVLYSRPGVPELLATGAKGQDGILDIAEQLVAVIGEEGAADGAPRGTRVSGKSQSAGSEADEPAL